jgi:hypothetical protein
MPRMLRLSTGLLAVSLLMVCGLNATIGQEATPPPYYELPEGLTIDALADTPNIKPPSDSTFSVGVSRYTYEPGVSFELEYHGPVLYVVEQGKLVVTDTKDGHLVFSATSDAIEPSPPPLGVKEGDEFILVQGQSVFSEDGHLGATRNAGNGPLVVLAVLIVPNPGGMTWDITGDASATPMHEIETGS